MQNTKKLYKKCISTGFIRTRNEGNFETFI